MATDFHPLIAQFVEHAKNGHRKESLDSLNLISQAIAQGDQQLIDQVVSPTVLTTMQSTITNSLGAPPRSMMLRRRVQNRVRRAMMFVRAMINGVERSSID